MPPGEAITVTAEWALHGMRPTEKAGYHLLASSAGRLSPRNFDEILSRFSPGTLDTLPQVTVSYVMEGNGTGYLGMAIHEADEAGAGVTFTRYFCVPYQELAIGAVSYVALFNALQGIRPADTDKQPVKVALARPVFSLPADAGRAWSVAMLLLTGNPVCVVDADTLSVADRLAFIDDVMSLLPYGLRAQMTAATSTSSTYRWHRFRLFFSAAPRRSADADHADHLFRWRESSVHAADAPRLDPDRALQYTEWLKSRLTASAIAKLAGITDPVLYRESDIRDLLERVHGGIRPADADSGDASQEGEIGRLLQRCARSLAKEDAPALRVAVRALRDKVDAARALNDRDQRRLRERIAERKLLHERHSLADQVADLYSALLRVAFPPIFDYQCYCQVEDMLDGPPHRVLLRSIEGLSSVDPAVLVIVRHLLRRNGMRLPFDLLTELAAHEDRRPRHAKIIFDFLAEAAGTAREKQIAAALPQLKRHGYFAAVLQSYDPGNLQYQVDILTRLLETVHGDNLDEKACREILAGQHPPPTVALLLAACRLAIPGNAAGILYSFMLGLMRSPELSNELRTVLAERGMREIAEREPAIVSVKPGRPGGASQEEVTRGPGSRTLHGALERLAETKDQGSKSRRGR